MPFHSVEVASGGFVLAVGTGQGLSPIAHRDRTSGEH